MLELLLKQEEGKTLEFKENAGSLNRILQTIVAFANTAGGVIVIGVRDKTKEIVGVKDILKEEERIANAIADSITPLITPSFQFHTWRNRDILIISVGYIPGPYYFKNKGIETGVYVRLGSTNRVADRAAITEIQRLAVHQTFDELPNFKAKEEDIDSLLAKELFSAASKRFDIGSAKSLNLLVEHQANYYPSNGAVLLFGKEHQNFFPNSIINCGCFAGTTKTTIIDQQDIDVPLPLAINRVLSFIERNTSKKSEIERLARIDIPQYPPVVVREAVLNAIVHADYSIKGANIQVAIFFDRMEITNPGGLPYGLSLEKALSGISQLRNRVIGHVFRELGLIEKWGSGFGRMIEICREQGITEPKFEEINHYFRVTLYHDKKSLLIKEAWQKIIIEYIKQHEYITIKDASAILKVTERTASTRLKKMCELGLVFEISTGTYDPRKRFMMTR